MKNILNKIKFKNLENWIKAFKITFMYANILLILIIITNGMLMYTTDKLISKTVISAIDTFYSINDEKIKNNLLDTYLKDLGDTFYILYKDDKVVKSNISSDLYYSEHTDDHIKKCIFVNNDIYLKTRTKDMVLYVPIVSINKDHFIIMIIFYFLFIILITAMLNKLVFKERNSYLEAITSKERELHREILTNIALNINHEMNSPLLVIRSIFDEIRYVLHEELNKKKQCPYNDNECVSDFVEVINDVLNDIDLGEDSLESIYSIIRPLGDYKSIEYSNGNKNFYMLIQSAINMIKYNKSYLINDIAIDETLEKYSLYHDNGMTNGTFLTMVINHIKNSLEANADKLKFYIQKIDEKYIYLAIEDNGNGIPKKIVKDIFNVNITSKADISKYERGVGMYINKILLKEKYDGDVWVEYTETNKGTIFILKIRYEPFKYYNDGVNHIKK